MAGTAVQVQAFRRGAAWVAILRPERGAPSESQAPFSRRSSVPLGGRIQGRSYLGPPLRWTTGPPHFPAVICTPAIQQTGPTSPERGPPYERTWGRGGKAPEGGSRWGYECCRPWQWRGLLQCAGSPTPWPCGSASLWSHVELGRVGEANATPREER